MTKLTIALAGGGTGGHIIPSIALLPELSSHFDRIIVIGRNEGIEKDIAIKNNLDYYHIPTIKLDRSKLYKNFAIPTKLITAIKSAKKVLLENNVDIVFSKGGYVALPTVIAASKLKIPVITHESDASIGLANKLSIKRSAKFITSFSTTKLPSNGIFIGSPIRKAIFEGNKNKVIESLNLNKSLPILLIMGGSIGALRINNCITDNIDILTEKYQVIHLTGKSYKKISHNNYTQLEFVDNIQDYLHCADVVISRCGAGSACEITALGKRVIYIPLDKGSRGDQLENAEYYRNDTNVLVLNEKNLSIDLLMKMLDDIMKVSPNPININAKQVNNRIVEEILKHIKK